MIEVPDAPPSKLLETATYFYPDRIVIGFLGVVMTYRELLEASERAAQVLRASEVHKDDRVALVMPNCPQHAMVLYGALCTDAAMAGHNPLAPAEEIHSQLDAHRARVVIVREKGIGFVTDPRPASDANGDTFQGRTAFSVDLSAAMPVCLRAALRLSVERARRQQAAFRAPWLPTRVRSRDEEVAGTYRIPSRSPYPAGSNIAALLHAGGTTGIPKATMLTYTSLRANANRTIAWVPMLHEGGEDFLCLLLFFHIFELTFNLFCAVQKAATQVMLLRFSMDQVLTARERRPFIFFVGVPVVFERILDGAQKRGTDLGTLHYDVYGAAPMPSKVRARWERATGGFFIEGYSVTETSSIIAGTPMGPSRHLGALSLLLPSTDMCVADPEDPDPDREVPDGEPGELLVRGPQVFTGYWEDETATQAAVLPGGWLRTDDIVHREDSSLWMADRKHELILTGGFNVYPSQVEATIRSMKGVVDVAVVGLPDGTMDELVCATVVLTEGAEPGSMILETVRKHTERAIPRHALPHRLEVVGEMPHSQIGKILRRVVHK